jgi:hypothetical protein
MRSPMARRGRKALVRLLLAALAGVAASWGSPGARAGRHDLSLLKLCPHRAPGAGVLNGQVPECTWVRRGSGGLIEKLAVPAEAETHFRSLMSELGAVLAPRLVVPADTLGFAGFQVAGELGVTRINSDAPYWNAVEGVSAENTLMGRPDGWLTTAGAFLRKGLWLGLPVFEAGAGVMSLLDSRMLSWQGYAKLALHEGFHRLPFPSLAVRGAISHLSGTDQARMTVTGLDLIVSKGFGVMGTFRLEPFAGWSLLRIHARSGTIDGTPSCDAYRVRTAATGQQLGDYCAEAQRGTENDQLAYFTFPDQDAIRRQRLAAGVKLKFATVFLTAQYEIFPGGDSRDESKVNGARDSSRRQEGMSLSAGFDY